MFIQEFGDVLDFYPATPSLQPSCHMHQTTDVGAYQQVYAAFY